MRFKKRFCMEGIFIIFTVVSLFSVVGNVGAQCVPATAFNNWPNAPYTGQVPNSAMPPGHPTSPLEWTSTTSCVAQNGCGSPYCWCCECDIAYWSIEPNWRITNGLVLKALMVVVPIAHNV
jgi:hypothetical protein